MDLKRVGCARDFNWNGGRLGPKGNIRRGVLYSSRLRLFYETYSVFLSLGTLDKESRISTGV